MSSQIIGGVINFRVDGQVLSTGGECTIDNFGGEVLEGKPSVSGDIMYSRTLQPASITIKANTTQSLNIRELKDARFIGVSVQSVNGSTYLLRDAVQVGEGTVNVQDGTMDLKFSGTKVEVI